MTKYAKLKNNFLEYAPKNKDNIINYNLDVEQLLIDGYKEVIEAEKPDYPYYVTYEETETQIIETVHSDVERAKLDKSEEALEKANYFEKNGTVEYKNCVFEMTDSNRKNLSDTQEALIELGETSTNWLDKNDEFVELTIDDIKYIRLNLILGRIRQLWLEDYPNYLTQINEAETIEEVEAINIEYE